MLYALHGIHSLYIIYITHILYIKGFLKNLDIYLKTHNLYLNSSLFIINFKI